MVVHLWTTILMVLTDILIRLWHYNMDVKENRDWAQPYLLFSLASNDLSISPIYATIVVIVLATAVKKNLLYSTILHFFKLFDDMFTIPAIVLKELYFMFDGQAVRLPIYICLAIFKQTFRNNIILDICEWVVLLETVIRYAIQESKKSQINEMFTMGFDE